MINRKNNQTLSRLVKGAIFVGTYPTRKLEDVLEFIKIHTKIAGQNPRWNSRAVSIFLSLLIVSLGVYYYAKSTSMPREASLMVFIFVFACLLWVSEAIPLFATSLLIIGLQVLLLANPGEWQMLGFENPELQPDFRHYFQPLAEPVIYLFLGGFILAHACVKRGVDQTLATWVLKYFGKSPSMLMLGVSGFTALFSMWMSNTATTAMMITLIGPIMAQIKDEKKYKIGLLLAIPFSANIGGMGTPIGSPPNAIALGFLQNKGIGIGFVEWMLIAVPIVIILIGAMLLFINWLYPPKIKRIFVELNPGDLDPKKVFVMFIFTLTVGLWITEKLHGLPTSVVALIPAVVFSVTGLITKSDINGLEWNVLILIAGGIALGRGMTDTGLDRMVIGFLPNDIHVLLSAIMLFTLLLSTVISNTAAANLVIPIGISAAYSDGFADVLLAREIAFFAAMSASLAMALPVSTPPNALAYSTGLIQSKEFVKTGIFIGFVGIILVYVIGGFLINLIF